MIRYKTSGVAQDPHLGRHRSLHCHRKGPPESGEAAPSTWQVSRQGHPQPKGASPATHELQWTLPKQPKQQACPLSAIESSSNGKPHFDLGLLGTDMRRRGGWRGFLRIQKNATEGTELRCSKQLYNSTTCSCIKICSNTVPNTVFSSAYLDWLQDW